MLKLNSKALTGDNDDIGVVIVTILGLYANSFLLPQALCSMLYVLLR